jgi:uncharacterized membrane protein YoaK (UPF0700 family)
LNIRRSYFAHPKDGPLPALLIGLTVLTGVIDAVSILSLGRVFVANMTGNVVFVGFALAGAPGFSVSAAIFALGGFLEGALLTGVAIGRFGNRRGALFRAAMLAQLALLVIALGIALVAGAPYGAGTRDAIAAICALAMGVQNAVVTKLAVPDLTTTVLTRTLTSIAVDLRAPAQRQAVARRVLAVLAMLAGAVVGALLVLDAGPTAALGLATGLLAIVTCAALAATRRPAAWQSTASPSAAGDLRLAGSSQ